MQEIYILDTAMPIPNKDSVKDSYKDATSKPVVDLNTSCTILVLTWAKEEYNKILRNIGIHTEFDFSNILVTFSKDNNWNTPKASFLPDKELIVIQIPSDDCTGRESDIQQSSIHEFAHAVTASSTLVRTAVTEGIAICFERLYCKLHGIPPYDNTIDTYLKSKNAGFSANELLRMSSILFYAKRLPSNPLQEYCKNEKMEQLRNDILQCFSDRKTIKPNMKLNYYKTVIRYIIDLSDKVCSKYPENLNTFLNTFDRELGLAMVNNNDLTLQIETVKNVYKKTANIMDSNTEPKIPLPNNDTHSDYDNR